MINEATVKEAMRISARCTYEILRQEGLSLTKISKLCDRANGTIWASLKSPYAFNKEKWAKVWLILKGIPS